MNEDSLRAKLTPYAQANTKRAWLELVLTLIGYGLGLYAIYYGYKEAHWLLYTVSCLVTSLFMVKVFTIQHDCGHGSFFKNDASNTWTGRIFSLITTMPFTAWKAEHDDHHGHVVDIDRLKHGDIHLLTVEQYRALSAWQKFLYRSYRHPLFILIFAPFLYFFVKSKFPAMRTRENILSVMLTNLFVIPLYLFIIWQFGFWTMVFVFVPAAYIGGIIGIGLFYLQHDYPDASWFKSENWSFEKAASEGSSLIILPQPLEWITHAIGYHHIHHVHSKIPGYSLRQCYEEVTETQTQKPLTWTDVLAAFTLKLWSHEKDALVSFAVAETVNS